MFRRTTLSYFAALAVLALLPAVPVAAQTVQPRLTQPIVEGNRVTLAGTVHPLARAQNDRGIAPDGMMLEKMHVVLKRSDEQESQLKQLISQMHSPGSASYHKWLTPDDFGKQFGPSDADVQTLTSWLQAKGFTVGGLLPGRQTLEISGTAGAFRNAFHAEIHRYVVNGETHYANASDPQIPAALAPVFGGFMSLNNFRIKSYHHLLGQASLDPVTHKVTNDWTVSEGTGQNYVLAPADFAAQYDIPNGQCPAGLCPTVSSTLTGTGQTIAIVNDANINVYLANQFRTLFGLPANPPQVIIDGSDPGIDGNNNPDGPNGDSVEAYLDVEWSGAVAPNATIDLVIAADTELESGLVLAMAHAIYSNVAPVVSLSFGSCEASLGTENQFLSGLFEEAAAQGITVLVSAGDSGSAGCDDDNTQDYAVSGQAVNGFASTPYNVAVGGTDFYYSQYNNTADLPAQLASYWNTTLSNNTPAYSIKGYIPEQPWNNSQFGLDILNYYTINGFTTIVGGGGGPSNCGLTTVNGYCAPYPKPSWQTGVSGIPADSVRDTPDVSLFAANGANQSYYPLCAEDGDCQLVSSGGQVQISGVGGTSASAPAFAGLMSLVNQKLGRQGQADYVLYPLAAQYPATFHDVTVGSNAMPCELRTANCITTTVSGPAGEGVIGSGTTQWYNAATGYDLASGLGSVDANLMIGNWNKITSPSPTTTTMTPSETSFTHGSTGFSVSGTVTGSSGTPTGIVELKSDSSEPSQQAQYPMTLTSGSFSLSNYTMLPGGTYNIWAQYSGDLNNAASSSAKTKITVSPENSGLLFVTTTPSQQGPTILTEPGATSYSGLPYGSEMTLFGLVGPSSVYTAFVNCTINNQTINCPSFTLPTGTVTFLDSLNSGSYATVINAGGEAEYSYPFPVGAHTFTAQYSGDNSYNSSSATAQTVTVVKSSPGVGLNIDTGNGATEITSNQPTVLHLYLFNNYSYGVPVAAPSGTVTLTGIPPNLTTPIQLTLSPAYDSADTYGVASLAINPGTLTPGNAIINISYSGDSNYTGGTTQAGVAFLAAATGTASTMTASVSSGTTSVASAVTLTITVTGSPSGAAPTGRLSLFSSAEGIGVYALPTVASGNSVTEVITLDSNSLLQGANQLSIWYSGDATYLPASASVSITNGQADFALTPTASVVGMPSSGVATDQILLASEFSFAGNVNLSCSAPTNVTCSVSPSPVTLAASGTGTTTLNLNTSAVTSTGNYPIVVTATDAATSTIVHTLNITAEVTSLVGAGFGMTNSGTITLASPGATGTATVTVTPTGGFTGSVALACSVTSMPTGAVNIPTCSVASPVTITGTNAGTATLTVNTSSSEVRGAPLERYFGLGGAALAMLVFLGMPRRRSWRGLLSLVVLSAAMVFGAMGCSSGSGNSSGGGTTTPVSPGTTYGSYGITVTGTSGSTTSSTVVTVVVN